MLAFAVASRAQVGGQLAIQAWDEIGGGLRRHDKDAADAVRAKVSSRLRVAVGPTASMSALLPLDVARTEGGLLRVTIGFDASEPTARAALESRGVRVETFLPAVGLMEGAVTDGDLEAVAELAFVRTIRPVDRAVVRIGSVVTEGDTGSRAPPFRSSGYGGQGVAVGVLSDGIDSLDEAVMTGDLGPVTVPSDARCRRGSGDEGTALLEIVHDVAPDAALLFAGPATALQMIDAVACLTAAGADVLVDDLGFFGEPFFEDGPVAQAVRAAVQAGVSYHSAAGNDAETFFEQDYRASPSTSFHDFHGGPVDNTDTVLLPPFSELMCVLQWNDAFGLSGNDYDLYILDASLRVVAESVDFQTGGGDPIEAAGVVNPAPYAQVAHVAIDRASGAARRFKLLCLTETVPEYTTASGSIFGHPALPEVVTVGAIDARDAGLDTVESFSSRGPVTIAFPSAQSRAKPDVAALDGVRISNAGAFPSCPPDCRFFGTSAAAPHSAGVAALLRSKNPLFPPSALREALRSGAVDIGQPGADNAAGAGRLDAIGAAEHVPSLECLNDAACNDGNACTVDACQQGVCVRAPLSCGEDGNVCNGLKTCEPSVGCVTRPSPQCADDEPCTTDSCDSSAGCLFSVLQGIPGTACQLGKSESETVCGALPAELRIRQRIAKLLRFVRRAARVARPAKVEVKQRQIRKRLAGLRRSVARAAAKQQLASPCAESLLLIIDAAACAGTPGCTPSTSTTTSTTSSTTSTTASSTTTTIGTTSSTVPSTTSTQPTAFTTTSTSTTTTQPTTTTTTTSSTTSVTESPSTTLDTTTTSTTSSSTSTSESSTSSTTSTTESTTSTAEPATTSSTSSTTTSLPTTTSTNDSTATSAGTSGRG